MIANFIVNEMKELNFEIFHGFPEKDFKHSNLIIV